jgi:hypothetical protein
MSAFYDQIDEILGAADDVTDILATVRKCWFYDFAVEPLRLWDGKGVFTDSNGDEWFGTVDNNGGNLHKTPSLQDGRDGTSASYTFSFNIPTVPGQENEVLELYNGVKSEQANVFGRKLTCYLVLFIEGEGLRPNTPISFYKEMTMFSPKFSETIERAASGAVVKTYTISITAKDNNHGRSERRAAQLGVPLDRGAEFLALLANRTYQVP